jgi:hypothetical protein
MMNGMFSESPGKRANDLFYQGPSCCLDRENPGHYSAIETVESSIDLSTGHTGILAKIRLVPVLINRERLDWIFDHPVTPAI